MKKDLKKYFHKWTYIIFFLVFSSLFYKLYELDIYLWSCETEGNTGSCLLASRLYLESNNKSMGAKYLRKSCEGEYALGCFELAKMLNDKELMIKACELGHKPACEL